MKKKFAEKGLNPISTEEGTALAKAIKAYAYVECSAKTTDGVKDVFDQAIKCVLFPKKGSGGEGGCCVML